MALCALPGCGGRRGTVSHLFDAERQVQREPARADLRVRWAEALAGNGQRFRAIEQLETARSLDPTARGSERLAELYEVAGEPEAAAEVRESAGTATARDLSRVKLDLGQFRGALAAVRGAPPDLRRARLTLLAGDWEGARSLLASLPDSPDRQSLQGFAVACLGEPAEGAAELRRAAQESGSAWDYSLLGQAELKAGDPARALQAWLRARESADAPPATRAGVPLVLVRLGRWEQAEKALQEAQSEAAEEPSYWEALASLEEHKTRVGLAHLARGKAAFFSGDPWQAERIYRAGLQRLSASEPREEVRQALYRALLDSAERRFDSATAMRYAGEALKAFPRDPLFLRRRGELLLEQNQYAEARRTAEQLLRVLPAAEAWSAHDLLARIGLESRDSELLRRALERCRELEPQRPEPSLLEAEWRQVQGSEEGRMEETLALYQAAARLDPQHVEAHANCGVLLVQLRRWSEAVPTLLRALELNPRVLEGVPNAQLVLAYRRTGREPEARFHERRYRTLRQLKDGWVNLLPSLRHEQAAQEYLRLGELALKRHDHWIALCAFRKASRLKPADARAWEGLAAAEKRLGHFDEALQAMRKAHLLLPVNEAA